MPRRSLLAVFLSVAMLAVFVGPSPAAAADPVPYLALGDSLAYGWDPVTGWDPSNPPGPAADPAFHHGYPETLGDRSFFEVTNASCPGETSGHFISRLAPENGCEGLIGSFGLKTDWGAGSQLDFAVAFLAANPDTGLVTIQLGANDLFLCQADPVDGCTLSDFVDVLGAVGANLGYSVAALRSVYEGPIVLMGYYALDYNDAESVAISQGSAQTLDFVASLFDNVTVADGFGAFEKASRRAGGDPCAAGLLLALPGGGCDIHTSPVGDRVMAQALHRAVDIGAVASGR